MQPKTLIEAAPIWALLQWPKLIALADSKFHLQQHISPIQINYTGMCRNGGESVSS
jgi:hypothetical protein